MVVEIHTELSPRDLLDRLKAIERLLGRQKGIRWGPREIDIDILCYDGLQWQDECLTLPHPGLPHRRFVLVPLAEVAPDLEVPGLQATVQKLLQSCPDRGKVEFFSSGEPLIESASKSDPFSLYRH